MSIDHSPRSFSIRRTYGEVNSPLRIQTETPPTLLRRFGSRGRQGAGLDFRLETGRAVGAVAEGLVLRMAAAAEANRGAARQVKRVPRRIANGEFAFHADRTVIVDGNLCQTILLGFRVRNAEFVKLRLNSFRNYSVTLACASGIFVPILGGPCLLKTSTTEGTEATEVGHARRSRNQPRFARAGLALPS